MNAHLDDHALQQLAAELEATPPRPHHSGLLQTAGRALPDRPFRFALSRGGWYRPGGIVRASGERVANSLEAWVQAALAACGGDDLEALVERHAGEDLIATRLAGRTHYFVAPYGPAPDDFLQLEIEELHEVLDRRLFGDEPPADLQELVDPLHPATLPAHPVGPPHYRFRRLTDVRHVVGRVPAPQGKIHPLARFLGEWAQSQARAEHHFCDHWIVALREHHDRYRNPLLSASPVSIDARKLKPFPWHPGAHGVEAASQLKAFDRAAGYPGAWYFHLVAGALAPRALAAQLAADLEAGYNYLRAQEAELLKKWLKLPYSA